MSQGLQVWDAGGTLRVDTSHRYAKFLGEVATTGTTDGSVAVGGLALGTPFAMVLPLPSIVKPQPPQGWVFPTARFSGTTLIWEFALNGLTYSKQPARILYGVF